MTHTHAKTTLVSKKKTHHNILHTTNQSYWNTLEHMNLFSSDRGEDNLLVPVNHYVFIDAYFQSPFESWENAYILINSWCVTLRNSLVRVEIKEYINHSWGHFQKIFSSRKANRTSLSIIYCNLVSMLGQQQEMQEANKEKREIPRRR